MDACVLVVMDACAPPPVLKSTPLNLPNPYHQQPIHQVANLISKPSGVRDLLSQDIYIHKDLSDRVALLHATLPKAVKVGRSIWLRRMDVDTYPYPSGATRPDHRISYPRPCHTHSTHPLLNTQADEILGKCRKEKRQPTPDEQKLIDEVEAAREIIIQVHARFLDLRARLASCLVLCRGCAHVAAPTTTKGNHDRATQFILSHNRPSKKTTTGGRLPRARAGGQHQGLAD